MATLHDIAQAAGVNIATVSRAINGNKGVSEQLRRKIIALAREMNYISNRREIEYSFKSIKTIGLVCPELKSEYYADVVDAVQERVKENGYTTLLAVSNFQVQDEREMVSVFGFKGVDGIMLVTNSPAKSLEWIGEFHIRSNIPVVLIHHGDAPPIEIDMLCIDNAAGIELALGHLFSLGHSDILYMGENLTIAREEAYVRVMYERLPHTAPRIIRVGTRFEEAGYEAASRLLQSGDKLPTAIFAAYDRVAIGAIRALQEAGISVPEDISIIGIDNIQITPYLYRKLTTVSSPVNELGAIASKILFDKIDSPGRVVQRVQIIPKLYVRETTAMIKL